MTHHPTKPSTLKIGKDKRGYFFVWCPEKQDKGLLFMDANREACEKWIIKKQARMAQGVGI